MQLSELKEILKEENPNALFADGFDGAIVGLARRCGQPTLVVYDVSRIIDILIERDRMNYDEAVEFFEFNIGGGWMGEHSPIYMTSVSELS